MESSLHRELKQFYAGPAACIEARRGKYRIDAVAGGELVEIQHASLAAIRDKIRALLARHRVRVVKPIVSAKLLVKCSRRGGPVVSRRRSPRRRSVFDLFDELVYFRNIFPHPRLTVEAVLVEIEEWRYPGHGRRRWRRDGDFVVQDRKLSRIVSRHALRTGADLCGLVGSALPDPFHTGDLADTMGIPRHEARRVAYCFRHMGAARQVGKLGNAALYRLVPLSAAEAIATRRRAAG